MNEVKEINEINEIKGNEYFTCKALSKMYTDLFYVPQWDEISEKVIFVESKYPKCVGMEKIISDYECYELPLDAELIILGFTQIW